MTKLLWVPEELKLFVYGSLKIGECNERVIATLVKSWEWASIRGELYLRPDKYPALFLSEYGVLGSRDYLEDLKLAEAPTPGGNDTIQGQLLTLNEGGRALAMLDDFEGYFPGSHSEYLRVAVSVETKAGSQSCWTYTGAKRIEAWPRISHWPPVGLVRDPEPYDHGL